MSLLPKSAWVSMPFLGQWLGRVRHAEPEKGEKKGNSGHSAIWWAEANREPFGHFTVRSRESITQKKESFNLRVIVWRDREKRRESVRELKRKRKIFFFAQVTHKIDKLVKFLWRFWVLQLWRVRVFKRRFCY